jgi:hypothetical protein
MSHDDAISTAEVMQHPVWAEYYCWVIIVGSEGDGFCLFKGIALEFS